MEMRSNKNIRIGDVLQELGYINEDQINQAVAYQKENKGVRLGAALIALGFITEKQMLEALGKRLHESGFRVTQATISRDIKELQLKKQADKNGKSKYICVTPGSASFGERYARVLQDGMVSIDQADNLVVIKTVSGMAMAVAAAIDALEIEEIVGSIAGDDTIMCAIRSVDDTVKVMDKISKIIL